MFDNNRSQKAVSFIGTIAKMGTAWTGFTGALVLLGVLALPGLIDPAQAKMKVWRLTNVERVGELIVSINKSETIKFDKEIAEAVVGSSDIVDVIPMTSKVVYVLGKKIGTTNLSLYDANKELVGVVDIVVSHDMKGLQDKINEVIRGEKITVKNLNGRVMLTGSVADAVTLKKALTVARQYAPGAVTNSMTVRSPQQVMLEVRFVEATRTAGKELGINVSRTTKNSTLSTGIGLVTGTVPFGTILTRLAGTGINTLDVTIRALERDGVVRILAEPNLVALSGDTASFLAGGEFPFPVASQDNTITIEFKKFGVGLLFTPTVLKGGLVNLEIEPEVSQLDSTRVIRVANTEIPSLIVRRAKTTIELRDGQSFAMAGLLQTNNTKNLSQMPWIADVPVLGALFRSSQYQKNETDLVIIVTPRIVKPVDSPEKLATPFDDRKSGNDFDLFLNGRFEVPKPVIEYMNQQGYKVDNVGHIIR